MLRTSLIKSAGWLPALLVFSLTGCGMTQGITDGTKLAFNAVFYKKIKMLHLDFTAREALNGLPATTERWRNYPENRPDGDPRCGRKTGR